MAKMDEILEIPVYPGPSSSDKGSWQAVEKKNAEPKPAAGQPTPEKRGLVSSFFSKFKQKKGPAREPEPNEAETAAKELPREQSPKKATPALDEPPKPGLFRRFGKKPVQQPSAEEKQAAERQKKAGGKQRISEPPKAIDTASFEKDISKINQELERINKELTKFK
jgi:hypothetical protein